MSARPVLLLAGAMFGAGLTISGMTLPERVIGFLDVTGAWNPSLALVMLGAIAVHLVLYRVVRKRQSPLHDEHFHIPTRRDVDARLIVGAAIFGVGWGIAGFCPGPALTSAAAGSFPAIVFVAAMTAGMILEHVISAIPATFWEQLTWKFNRSTIRPPTR